MKTLVALLASTWVTMTVVSTLETTDGSQPLVIRSEVQRPVVLWKPAVPISTAANFMKTDSSFPTIQHCVETTSGESLNVRSDTYRF